MTSFTYAEINEIFTSFRISEVSMVHTGQIVVTGPVHQVHLEQVDHATQGSADGLGIPTATTTQYIASVSTRTPRLRSIHSSNYPSAS